jgi:DNA-binding XRE family transcriptional regulator
MDLRKLGNQLKQVRKSIPGKGIDAMASATGLHKKTILAIERGENYTVNSLNTYLNYISLDLVINNK